MRVLLVLLLFILVSSPPAPDRHFIVFTNDGTFYKLDPAHKEVEWYSSLPFKLLTVDISEPRQNETTTKKIFIPTIDGDFLYLEQDLRLSSPRQILVPREDVESLLDVCFSQEAGEEKYFVYERSEFFVLNTIDGHVMLLEEFFNQKLKLDRHHHAVIRVSKKLLKQLGSHFEVKWSVISSRVSLTNADEFTLNKERQDTPIVDGKYEFVRMGSKTIEIYSDKGEKVFEIQASSPILAVFADRSGHFPKVEIKNAELKMLALEASPSEFVTNIAEKRLEKSFQDFPASKPSSYPGSGSRSTLQVCINTQKVIKQLSEGSGGGRIVSQNNMGNEKLTEKWQKYQELMYKLSPQFAELESSFSEYPRNMYQLPTIPFSSDEHQFRVVVTKEQPYVYIFLMVIFASLVVGFYRLKVNKMFEKMTQLESKNDARLKEITEKLGEYEIVGKELKKMYEINWNKLLYMEANRRYMVFEGRFLAQQAEVYVVPLQGNDIIDIEHQLNLLINCSHRSIAKLYYYTRSEDSLLIFSERCYTAPSAQSSGYLRLSDFSPSDYSRLPQGGAYREQIKIFLDCLSYIDGSGIELSFFSPDSLLFLCSDCQKQNRQDSCALRAQTCFDQIRINIIPSFLFRWDEDEEPLTKLGTTPLRLSIVNTINKLGLKGADFDIQIFEKEKNTKEEDNFFLKDFYDHLLTSQTGQGSTETAQEALPPVSRLTLQGLSTHPYLWDSKQRMFYICEFSNYLETCIDEQKIQKMEAHCRKLHIINLPWVRALHPIMAKQVNNYRKYDYNSVRDLIRLLRNKLSHFHEMSKEAKGVVGKTPEQFMEHILERFPKLLPFMYVYATRKKWKMNVE